MSQFYTVQVDKQVPSELEPVLNLSENPVLHERHLVLPLPEHVKQETSQALQVPDAASEGILSTYWAVFLQVIHLSIASPLQV